MPAPLVECVPNFSEGRRREVIAAILQSIHAIPGAHVLDRHSDPDHHRTVVTMVGSPKAMERAAFAAVACAASRIDLAKHAGAHPRIGAADVVPFIPLQDFSMAECVSLARRLGRRVGEELKIPVYFYEAAALRPDRRNLEAIRKGQFEGLQYAIRQDPARAPDCGPETVGSAGATAIGARQPLIAFNIFLVTGEAEIAREIARAIRTSSGGLPNLKALGLRVEDRAQVSMNLTDYTRTSLPQAYEAVRREAERRGTHIAFSEIVGLIPEAAMTNVDPSQMRIRNITPRKILERRLEALHLIDRPVHGSIPSGGGPPAEEATFRRKR